MNHQIKRLTAFALIVIASLLGTLRYTDTIVHNTTDKINRNLVQIDKLEQVQEQSQLSACHRLNILRASDNLSHYADYKFFTLTTKLLKESLKTNATLTPSQKRATALYIVQLQQSANAKTWIKPTQCNAATVSPTKFKVPVSVRFVDKIPPKSVFIVGPGE